MKLDAPHILNGNLLSPLSQWERVAAPPGGGGGRVRAGDSFATTLDSLGGSHGRETPGIQTPDIDSHGRESSVRQAAQQLVSSALLLPTLALLRASGPTEGPFAPGDAERRFGPLLDQHMADRIVGSTNFSLVDDIVKQMMRHDAPASESSIGLSA